MVTTMVSMQTVKSSARMQGVACDACKFRKVKCDRRQKLEQKAEHEDESQIACTVCSQHGLRCTFTQSAPRRRRGKRIVAVQRAQLEDIDDSLAQRSLEAERQRHSSFYKSDGQQDQVQQARQPFHPTQSGGGEDERRMMSMGIPEELTTPALFGYDDHWKEEGSVSNASRVVQEVRARSKFSAVPSSRTRERLAAQVRQGLFGVRGLTRALLDACVRAYFKYAAPCMPIVHVEVFSERYTLFFALFEEKNGEVPQWKDLTMGMDDMPLSLLLILAVGCVGAALLEPPIAEPGSQAKFRLQDRLALRFQEVLKEKDIITRLKEEGADVLEACYIMSDPTLPVLGDDQRDREIDFETLLSAPISQREKLDPLKMSPSTSEAVIRLLFAMGLNRRPKARLDCPPGDTRTWFCGGIPITQREVFRRIRIFWSVFMQDSFRSMGTRKKTLISEDDYDLDLPRIIPRKDGFFTAMLFYSNSDQAPPTTSSMGPVKDHVPGKQGPGPDPQVYLQPARFARFDALHLEVMLRLAFIIRTVSIRFVSPRAQGKGVLINDVEKATSSLNAWRSQLPPDVTWDVQAAPLLRSMKQGKQGSNNAIALRNSIKSLFVEMLYLANVLRTWASVSDYGIRFEVDLTEAVHLFAMRMGLDNNTNMRVNEADRAGMISMLDGKPHPDEIEDKKQKAREGMDRLAAKGLLRVAKICKEAGMCGLMRANRSVLLNVSSSYAVWACDLGRRISQTGNSFGLEVPPGQSAASLAFSCAEDLIFAMSTIDSFEKAPDVVKQIGGLLRKSRESVASAASPNESDYSRSSVAGDNVNFGKDSISPEYTSHQSSDSTTPEAANMEQPFHYFFGKGQRLDFGNTLQGISKPVTQSSLGSTSSFASPETSEASSMETDEVVQLANAAFSRKDIPRETAPIQARQPQQMAFPTSQQQLTSSMKQVAAQDPQIPSEPNVDLLPISLPNVDAQWLTDYLSGTDQVGGLEKSVAPNAPSQFTSISPVSFSAYGQPMDDGRASAMQSQSFTSRVGSGDANYTLQPFGVPAIAWDQDPTQTEIPMNVEQAATQAAGLDLQWDQLMANAGDAQLWAESQWQGFSFAPPTQSS